MPASPPFWANLTFWIYLIVWLPFALFVVLYATRSPWQSTPVGRAVMSLAVSITAVLTFVLIVIVFPIPDGAKQVLRAVVLGGVAIAGWLMVRQLLTQQNAGRRQVDGHPLRRSTDGNMT